MRAKGLACIHMAKLSLPLLNIMDSSILTFGNSPCLVLSLEECPGMLAGTGQPNNIDIEGSVFTIWFPAQHSNESAEMTVQQHPWLCVGPVWFTSVGVAKEAIRELEVPTH